MNLLTKNTLAISFLLLVAYLFSNLQKNNQDASLLQVVSKEDPLHFCGTAEFSEQLFRFDPTLENLHHQMEDAIYNLTLNSTPDNRTLPNYTLPVVVHIIHDNGAENISDAAVLQGIQHLNEAFANMGYYDQGTGVNTEIEFCMATRDPDGNPTNGITRNVSPLTEVIMEEALPMKDINRWTPTEYINIWVIRDICSYSMGCGVAGFAFFPSSHGSDNDGIVIEANYMGNSNANAAVLIHEMGHYLGLYHTFRQGCPNGDCLANGDKVCDTPPDKSNPPLPCNGSINSCTTDVNTSDPNNTFSTDQNDMFWNYMDYSDYDCVSAFTAGQTARMDYFINNIRSSLLTAPSCLPPCLSPIDASFSSSSNFIDVGSTVNFNNTSFGANAFDWQIDGASFSANNNESYNFPDEGTYIISLTVTNNDPNCFDTYSDTIVVVCPVVADFEMLTSIIPANELLAISNTSSNGLTYEWFINGVSQGNEVDFSFSLANPSVVQVCLETTGQFCNDAHCQLVNIIEINDSDCELTYFKSIGDPQKDEGARIIRPAQDGGYFIAGRSNDRTLIIKMSPNSEVVWTRTFKFFGYSCDIWDLDEDSENNLIVVGSCGNGTSSCFAYKYNYFNNDFEWYKLFPIPEKFHFWGVEEKEPGGNYMIIGQNTTNNAQDFGCEAFLMEINRDVGSIVWKKNYNLGRCDFIRDIIMEDTSILVAGSFNNADSGNDKVRGSLTRFNFSGNVLWSRLYLIPVTDSARIIATNILIDEDKIINVSYGDTDGVSTVDVDIQLYATDIDGNILWATKYDIPDGHSERTGGVLSLADGYMIYGFYNETNFDKKTFLIKTNKQGQVQWSKSYGGSTFEEATSITLIGDFIYFVGTRGNFLDTDVFLARVYKDGELSVACDDINLLNVEETPIINPYDGLHTLYEYFPSIGIFDFPDALGQITDINITDICGIPYCIEICGNGIDDDGDQLVDAFDPDCACNDSLTCASSFYNNCTPACEFFPASSSFDLEVVWSRTGMGETNQPAVADVNGDCVPDVIAVNSNGTAIEVISSISGLTMMSYATNLSAFTHLAAGDTDHDGMAEIFYVGNANGAVRLIRLDYDIGSNSLIENWQSSEIINANGALSAANYSPALADFDYNDISEVYVGNQIFDGRTGLELVNGGQNNQGSFYISQNFMTSTAIAADVLSKEECGSCHGLELVAGGEVYTINIASYTNPGLNSIQVEKSYTEPTGNVEGATRLVDFDRDGDLDVVVTTQSGPTSGVRILIWDILSESLIGNVFSGLPNPASQRVGPVSIGDVDADGWPEIIVATSNNLTILEDYQNGGGINWGVSGATIKATILTNEQSGATGATLFDLNGDGSAEIFYRDENNLRIFDGDLNELVSTPCSSLTGTEYPIVADIDGDRTTELLCACEDIGLTAFQTTGMPWLKSRSIWNQYNYLVTNINDDGTIPVQQQNFHIVGDSIILNGFLMQQIILDTEGTPINPAPDAELNIDTAFCNIDSVMVNINICNNGSDILSAETPVAFYFGNPNTSIPVLVMVEQTGIILEPDSCWQIPYSIPDAINQAIYVVINDDGSGSFPYDFNTDFPLTLIGECNFQNNMDSVVVNVILPPELDLGADILVCENGVFEFNAGTGFDFYEWHDGTEDSTFTSFGTGTFWVTAWNICGEIQSDTVAVTIDSALVFDLGLDTVLCGSGGSVTLSAPGYDDYQWFPGLNIDCDTCETATMTPVVSTTYTLVASTDAGCVSVDSITIILSDTSFIEIDTVICDGMPLLFDGIELLPNTSTYFSYSSVLGCDSTVLVHVSSNGFLSYYEEIDTTACLGTSVLFDGITIETDSTYVFDYQTIEGCDSTIVIHVLPLDTFYMVENEALCEGESILIFGNPETSAGDYSMTYSAVNGCDSTVVVSLQVFDAPEVLLTGEPSCPDDSTGAVTTLVTGGNAPFTYQWNTTLEDVDELQGVPVGTYSLTITDANNCADTADITITDVAETLVIGESISVSCFGENDGIYTIDSSFVDYLFSLDGNTFQNSLTFSNLLAGTYDLYIQDSHGCEYTHIFTVNEPPPLVLSLPQDTSIQLGCIIELESVVNRFDSVIYTWNPPIDLSCLDCPLPFANPLETTMYTLMVTDSSGCTAEEDILVSVSKQRNIYIPNVFSPNFDGLNDVFMIYGGKGVAEIRTFAVFDRWGEQLFEARNFQSGDADSAWDGTFKGEDLNPGVYVYWAEVVYVDGKVELYQGDVTLVR